jgi:hypothetical protein
VVTSGEQIVTHDECGDHDLLEALGKLVEQREPPGIES